MHLNDLGLPLKSSDMEVVGYFILFVVSMAALIKASDWFVSSAETIGLSLGISPFVIGVTLVAFGTSLPELAASIAAVARQSSEIVIGNVVGSNITNILLVIGLSAVIGKEILVDKESTANKLVMLLASAFLMYFTLQDLILSLGEAILYLAGMALFLLSTIGGASDDAENRPKAGVKNYALVIGAAALVYGGAHFTIVSIEEISETLGVPNEVIALTGVALGTSLPEVVVSVTAVLKGKSDIAIGNVLGSNIFNTFAVMGIPRLFGDLIIPASIMEFSIPMMVGVTIIFAFMFFESKINRWEGMMLIVLYCLFVYMSFGG